jgi:multisubunit Na+/H+ antiporter MnhB subunit
MHHKLLDCQFGHVKTVVIIYIFSVVTVATSLTTYFFESPTYGLLAVVLVGASFLMMVISLNKKKNKARAAITRN